ncbi:MAG: helix-turn-helix transcriptional regulator [Kordiimonas sp.]
MAFAQDTFKLITEFMAKVGSHTTIEQLNGSLKEPLAALKVTHMICISAMGMPALQNRKAMFGFRRTEWLNYYRSRFYYLEDAIPQKALSLHKRPIQKRNKPVWWSDILAEQELTPIQYKIFREAYDHGLKEGIIIPIISGIDDNDGVTVTEYAYAVLAGNITKSDLVANTLRTMMIAAHGTSWQILVRESKRAGGFVEDTLNTHSPNVNWDRLTKGEMRILSLYLDNDTYDAIAAAAGCSESNVKAHLASARKKLGFTSNKEMLVALLRHREAI